MGKTVGFGGMPTDYDVNLLLRAYPLENLKPGDIIPYTDVENLLNTKKGFRFNTVTNRWRSKVLRESTVIIGCERGTGFKILDDSGKVNLGSDKLRCATRMMRKSVVIVSKADRKNLSEEEKRQADFISLNTGKAMSFLQIKAKVILPEI